MSSVYESGNITTALFTGPKLILGFYRDQSPYALEPVNELDSWKLGDHTSGFLAIVYCTTDRLRLQAHGTRARTNPLVVEPGIFIRRPHIFGDVR